MKNVKLYGMIAILSIAGIIHLIKPEAFLVAMPSYLPFHLEIVYFTGVLELVFAIGLALARFRYWSSLLLAAYFVAILPAHFHIAMNGIEMFGVSDPIVLWGRTAFQAVLIWWALSLRKFHART